MQQVVRTRHMYLRLAKGTISISIICDLLEAFKYSQLFILAYVLCMILRGIED